MSTDRPFPDAQSIAAALRVRIDRFETGQNVASMLEPAADQEVALLSAAMAGHPQQYELSHLLGWAHWYRSTALRDNRAQTERDRSVQLFAIAFIAGAEDIPTPLLPTLAEAVAGLVSQMLNQAVERGDEQLLSATITGLNQIRAHLPAEHDKRPGCLSNLGVALRTRYRQTHRLADLDDAIRCHRDASDRIPPGDPDRTTVLVNLTAALVDRFRDIGSVADLDDAVQIHRDALTEPGLSRARRSQHLTELGSTLSTRFERFHADADLDHAVRAFQAAVKETDPTDPNRTQRLVYLGSALQIRFDRAGAVDDLEQAITARRAVLASLPADHPDRGRRLGQLSHALAGFGPALRTAVPTDVLDRGIDALREAATATELGQAFRASTLSNLGSALLARFDRTGELADLDDAIRAHEQAAHWVTQDQPDHGAIWASLGIALRARFDQFDQTAALPDLHEAIRMFRVAVATTPPDHPDHPDYARHLADLASVLRERFDRFGAEADLDTTIQLLRDAVRCALPDDRIAYLANLGQALRTRFDRAGAIADADEAIQGLRAALAGAPADSAHCAAILGNLGAAQLGRLRRQWSVAEANDTVRVLRAALAATTPKDPHHRDALTHLGHALWFRFHRTGELADLDEAIHTQRQAATHTPPDHPDRAYSLSNLGTALSDRFDRTGEPADLDEAIHTHQQAITVTPTDHPERARRLAGLGHALEARFKATGSTADRDLAIAAFTETIQAPGGTPAYRVIAARRAGHLLADVDRAAAADVFERAVRLLPTVAPRALRHSDQQAELEFPAAGLGESAAAAALNDPRGSERQRAERAVVFLESCRGILLSQTLDTRTDLSDLHDTNLDLAKKYTQLRDLLEQPGTAVDQRRVAAAEFATVTDQIRALGKNFATFGLPPSINELLAEAGRGPIVMVNVTLERSDALVLTPGGVTVVSLPGVTLRELVDRIREFEAALRGNDNRVGDVLAWLWDSVAEPVLSTLDYTRTPPAGDWPRLWWMPNGLISLLPLHAAGHHTDPIDDPRRRAVHDRVVSSYTPTVRALRHARARQLVPAGPPNALVVGMPTTPGLPDGGQLPGVPEETDAVRRHFRDCLCLVEPEPGGGSGDAGSPPPTTDKVLEELPRYAVAHFACHGVTDRRDPSRSRLLLHDHATDPLTVTRLGQHHLGQARLAYLSACRTTAIDNILLVDEAIHLAGACQLAGYPQVIGTLWEISDRVAVYVADAFYTRLTAPDGTLDTTRGAHALHHTVRELAHQYPDTPWLWAAYLHTGA